MLSAKCWPFCSGLNTLMSKLNLGYYYQEGLIRYQLHLVCISREVSNCFNTLRPRQDGRHFADDIFTCIFSNENCCILIKFSLKYVRRGPIDNHRALDQIMAWRQSGDKPSSEPMMISLPTHIYVTRPQWVNRKTLKLSEFISLCLQLSTQWDLDKITIILLTTFINALS